MDTGSLVTVSRNSRAVTYQIHEKNLLDTQGFKTLQGQYDKGFVKCSKGMINGSIRLTYNVSEYVTLRAFLPELDNQKFLTICFHLLQTALALRDIGFLQRENISIDPADIFINKDNCQTYLIYVPLCVRTAPNAHMKFEKNLRGMLVQIADSHFKRHQTQLMQEIRDDLANEQVNLKEIVTKIETQALQTTEENTSKINDLRVFGATKPYPLTNPLADEKARKMVDHPATDTNEPAPRPQVPLAPEKPKKTREQKQKMWRDIGFFLGYCAVLVVVVWIIAHYYSNSGLTVSFIGVCVAVLILAFLVPVLYNTSKKRKGQTTAIVDKEILLQTPVHPAEFMPAIVLKNISSEINLEFYIQKKEFVIGKKQEAVDGFIPYDVTISDQHCKVIWNGKFYILDLGSDYGTFVNDDRVIPGQAFPLRTGDRVRLNKHIFLVSEI